MESYSRVLWLSVFFKVHLDGKKKQWECYRDLRDFYMYKMFQLKSKSFAISYNTRFNTDISLSHIRTDLVHVLFYTKTCKMSNSIPNDLKSSNDFQKFNRTLKSCLMNT